MIVFNISGIRRWSHPEMEPDQLSDPPPGDSTWPDPDASDPDWPGDWVCLVLITTPNITLYTYSSQYVPVV